MSPKQKKIVHTSEVVSPFPPYPVAVTAAGLVFLSGIRGGRPGHVPTTYDDLPEHARAERQGYTLADHADGTVTADSWAVHENLETILQAAGTRGDQMLRQHIWQRDKRYFPNYESVRIPWQPDAPPSSGIGVADVPGRYGRWIGIDGIAVVPDADPRFPRRVPVNNNALPSASHYLQAVRSGSLVFLAGHLPIKTDQPGKPVVNSFDDIPEEGRFLARGRSHPDSRLGPIASQTWYTYDQIRRNLDAQGLTMNDVIHVEVYLSDLRDFGTFHRVHEHFFPHNPPALCVTGFEEVGHRGCRIEIEPTALIGGDLDRRSIDWPHPAPFGGPAGVKVGPVLFLGGMLGLDDAGHIVNDVVSLPPEGRAVVRSLQERERSPGLAAQCWTAWHRMRQTLEAANMSTADLVKTTVYLQDPDDLYVYEAVRREFIEDGDNLPAFEAVIIHGPGPVSEAAIQINPIAVAD